MYPFINARFVLLWLWFASPVLWCGCGGKRLDVPSPGTYSPLVAVSLGIAASDTNPTPSPGPSPSPSPAGRCSDCNGTGRRTMPDGNTAECGTCGGDGKIESTADEIVPSLPISKPAPYARTPRVELPKSNPPPVNVELLQSDCADGSCSASGDGGGRRGLFGRWRR